MDFEIDSHFHIWDLKKFDYPWPTSADAQIFRDVTSEEYESNICQTPVKYGVFVKCLNNSPEETLWVLNQNKSFIKGVVAGVSITDPKELENELQKLSQYPEFVGGRVINVADDDWMTHSDVIKGMELLTRYDKTFDILVKPHNLPFVPQLISSAPEQRFVIDHMAKPYIKDGKIDSWKEDMSRIAKYPNVYCKISGLVTEADFDHWEIEHLRPYVQHIVEVFGTDRCLFGSDWPVCTLAHSDYKRTYDAYSAVLNHLTPRERGDIFKNNAIKFYKLKV